MNLTKMNLAVGLILGVAGMAAADETITAQQGMGGMPGQAMMAPSLMIPSMDRDIARQPRAMSRSIIRASPAAT
ncbi:MAG: hypothetical protein K0B00_13785 [Rhodobacteraceae bacterium]|nr:hypothetical protein [Paracoccaceae bacterium]